MAIQGGFKMTELGMIPSDWEVKTLGELYRVHNGLSKGKQFFGHGYPFLSFSVVFNNVFIPNKLENLVDSSKEERASYSINKGDVFITRTSETVDELGMSCVALKDYPNATYNGFCKRLRPNDVEFVNLGYLGFYLRSDFIREWFLKFSTVTTRASLKNDELLSLPLVLPPTIEEQQRIAKALSDIDTLIANLEKLIAKKKNIKQGAMQQLLTGKKRLPGFAPAKPTYKQTELGIIPSDWEVKKIGEFTKLQAGGTPSTLCDEFWGGNIRWMNSGELNNKRIYDVAGRITKLGLNSSSTHLIPSNCVLVGLAGQGKTRGTAAINYVELCTNQSIAAMFPSKTHNSEYLYHNIDSRYEELRELSSGDGGRGGLNLGILANLFIALPSKAEQTAIANVLSDMDTEISALETKLAKYRTLKTGMMQQLLTGKIRLV